jgi:hypothetical protein
MTRALIGLVFAVLAAPALGQVQADRSLTPEQYSKLGWPRLDEPWTPERYQGLTAAVLKLSQSNPDQLPRAKSKRSGPYFLRMIDRKLVAGPEAAKPLGEKLNHCLKRYSATSTLVRAYALAQKRLGCDLEVAHVFAFQLSTFAELLGISQRFVDSLPADDPSREVRRGGWKKMQSGLATMLLGCLRIVGDTSFDEEGRRILVAELVKATPPLIRYLSPSGVELVRSQTATISRTSQDAGVQGLIKVLSAALGPAPKPAKSADPVKVEAPISHMAFVDTRYGIRTTGIPPSAKEGSMVMLMASPRTTDARSEVIPFLLVRAGGAKKTVAEMELEARERSKTSKVLQRVERKVSGVDALELLTESALGGRVVRSRLLFLVHEGHSISFASIFARGDKAASVIQSSIQSLRLFSPKSPPADLEQIPAGSPGRLIHRGLGFSLDAPKYALGLNQGAYLLQFIGEVMGVPAVKMVAPVRWENQDFSGFLGHQTRQLAAKGMQIQTPRTGTWRGLPSLEYETVGSRQGETWHGLGFAYHKGTHVIQTAVFLMGGSKSHLRGFSSQRHLGTEPLKR